MRNLLVLLALVGSVSLGWLVGHILRYSTPALWHPPIQEHIPQTKNGYQFEFEGEGYAFTPQESLWLRVCIDGELWNVYTQALPILGRARGGEDLRLPGTFGVLAAMV